MSSSEWDEFFATAGQYYVVGRFAAFAGLIPITGNLLHHAVEMFLKGGLSKNGSSLVKMTALGLQPANRRLIEHLAHRHRPARLDDVE